MVEVGLDDTPHKQTLAALHRQDAAHNLSLRIILVRLLTQYIMSVSILERREFIRRVAMLALFLGVEPLAALSSEVHLTEDVLDAVALAQEEYLRFLQQFTNYATVSSLSDSDVKQQYNGMLKLLAKGTEPTFARFSEDKRLQVVQQLKPFEKPDDLKQKQYDQLYRAFYTGAIASGAVFLTVKGNVRILTGLAGISLKLAPWMEKAGYVLDGATKIYGGWKLLSGALSNDALQAADSTKLSFTDRFFPESSFRFQSSIPHLQLAASDANITAARAFDETKINNPAVKEFYALIKRELGNPTVLNDQARLEAFLEQYTQKVGSLQEESLKKLLNAQQKADAQAALEQRDTAALLQGVQNFVGSVVISQLAAPKEAEILNTLLSAGFQYALTGMTPMGWAAVGISIAGSLLKKSSAGFEKALFAALKQIQRQLTIISQKIDVLYDNQLVIINQLNTIIARINRIEDLLVSQFSSIALKQDLLYNTVLVMNQQQLHFRVAGLYNDMDSSLQAADSAMIYTKLLELRNVATNELAGIGSTKFAPGTYSAQVLVQEVFFAQRYKYNISLYDTIGLVSALHSYNPLLNAGTCDTAVVHPPDFRTLSNDIVNWLVLADLSHGKKKDIAAKLLAEASRSRAALNQYARKDVVEEKAESYSNAANQLLLMVQAKAYEIEKYEYTHNAGPLLRQFKLHSTTHVDLASFVDASIQDNNKPANFTNNRNDSKIFNLLIELKLIQSITTVAKTAYEAYRTRPFECQRRRGSPAGPNFSGFEIGSIVGSKTNRIVFYNVLVDADKQLRINYTVDYQRFLRIQTFADIYEPFSIETNLCFIHRKVQSTYSTEEVQSIWKSNLRAAFAESGTAPEELFPDFNNITFNDFLQHLINQEFKKRKREHINSLLTTLRENAFATFDGVGTALLVLSKLNQLVSSPQPIPYVLDYYQELYNRDDISMLLTAVATTDFDGRGLSMLDELRRQANAFEYPGDAASSYFLIQTGPDTFSSRLDPTRFMDLCLIALNKQMKDTHQRCLVRATALDDQSCEPQLKEAIAKLRWFQDAYLT